MSTQREMRQPMPSEKVLQEELEKSYSTLDSLLGEEVLLLNGEQLSELSSNIKIALKGYTSINKKLCELVLNKGSVQESTELYDTRREVNSECKDKIKIINKQLGKLNFDCVSELDSLASDMSTRLKIGNPRLHSFLETCAESTVETLKSDTVDKNDVLAKISCPINDVKLGKSHSNPITCVSSVSSGLPNVNVSHIPAKAEVNFNQVQSVPMQAPPTISTALDTLPEAFTSGNVSVFNSVSTMSAGNYVKPIDTLNANYVAGSSKWNKVNLTSSNGTSHPFFLQGNNPTDQPITVSSTLPNVRTGHDQFLHTQGRERASNPYGSGVLGSSCLRPEVGTTGTVGSSYPYLHSSGAVGSSYPFSRRRNSGPVSSSHHLPYLRNSGNVGFSYNLPNPHSSGAIGSSQPLSSLGNSAPVGCSNNLPNPHSFGAIGSSQPFSSLGNSASVGSSYPFINVAGGRQ